MILTAFLKRYAASKSRLSLERGATIWNLADARNESSRVSDDCK
jgi:hypothetical protein